jgi:hypothetical protein
MARLGEIARMVRLADGLKVGDAVPLIPRAASIVRATKH